MSVLITPTKSPPNLSGTHLITPPNSINNETNGKTRETLLNHKISEETRDKTKEILFNFKTRANVKPVKQKTASKQKAISIEFNSNTESEDITKLIN